MSYETVSVTAAVSRAVLAIPGAIKDLRGLLGKTPGSQVASEHLQTLKASIVDFCSIHLWLREAKDLHDRLTTLDSMLEGAFRETAKAIASGPFNPDAFNVPDARKSWNAAKTFGLLKLLSFAEGIAHLCPAPLQTDASGDFVSGPTWARRLIELRNEIDRAFKKYDGGDQNAKYQISDSLDAFSSLVKTELIRANEAIREEAARLSDELHKLQGALVNV